MENSNIVITGDFNIHVDDVEDPDVNVFLDTLEALGLTQHVCEPTHEKGYILDLVITEQISKIGIKLCQVGDYISDHKIINSPLLYPRQLRNKKK